MSISPIERMIDDACGVGSKPVLRINLYCRKCHRVGSAIREVGDPDGAVVANIQCPECVGGDFDSTEYFDANGEPVPYVG